MNPHQIRQARIYRIRNRIQDGFTLQQLHDYAAVTMGIEDTRTRTSLIDEAAQPFRLKYAKEQESQKTLHGKPAVDEVVPPKRRKR